jgi:hypothetical protein
MTQTKASYLLRDIDRDLWKRIRAKAKADGLNMRWVILRLLESYLDRGLPPKLKR